MKKEIKSYNFERISGTMAKKFGVIRPGQEEAYEMILFPIESNLLKPYRRNDKRNERRVLEAIHICLWMIVILRTRNTILNLLHPKKRWIWSTDC